MKKIFIMTILGIALGVWIGRMIFHPEAGSNISEKRKILYYRDPMNPQITSTIPKKSSDGMDFVPVYAEETKASGEKKIAYYKDPMHPWYTSDKPGKAPDCGMDLVPVYEGEGETQGIKIDPITIQNIGVKIEAVTKRKLNKSIRAVARVDYDETKVYSINTKIMGWIEKLNVDYTGRIVHKGEPLMELYSPELVTTQEEYLQALRYQKELYQSSVEEARKGAGELVQSTKRRLLYWDIPESEIKALEERGTPKKTMMFYSPVDGIVMEKMVLKGQNVMAGMELFKIADLSTVWILADIYQFDLPWVKVGQTAEIELSYLPGKSFEGTLSYVYPYLNPETKTAKVRIVVRNTLGIEFKPDMFAMVKIASPMVLEVVAIPEQAVIRSGERNIAVIDLGGGYFDPRDVKLGVTADGFVQVLEGVNEGEKIVVSSQFLIDSESNLKAAISLMTGHSGRDMSKPMQEQPGTPEEHNVQDTVRQEMKQEPVRNEHEGKEMKNEQTSEMKNLDTAKVATLKKKQLYTCEMDPDVISDKPGNCPKCGMKLIPLKNAKKTQ